jgi:hypothetical protein
MLISITACRSKSVVHTPPEPLRRRGRFLLALLLCRRSSSLLHDEFDRRGLVRRSRGFALTAIAVLALGIGVNLAEIHVFNVLLHHLDVRDLDSLCQFFR